MSNTLEEKVKAIIKENKALQKRLTTLEDIEAIQKLQRAYGFYNEHLMYDEVAELWADDGELQYFGIGIFKGKEAIRKEWKTLKEMIANFDPPSYMHLSVQCSPYITIAPDGKKAWGRWYGIHPNGWIGLYEEEYIKENGIWKIKIMQFGGFPMQERAKASAGEDSMAKSGMAQLPYTKHLPRVPRQEWPPFIRPFSFKHPVTGKDVNKTVKEWNDAHPAQIPKGDENWV